MSSKNESKKSSERAVLNGFLRHMQNMRCVDDQCEAPDFVVEDEHGFMGMELREMSLDETPEGSVMKRNQRLRAACLRDIERCYYDEMKGTPIHVIAVKLDLTRVRKSQRKQRARAADPVRDAARLLLKAAARNRSDQRIDVPDRTEPRFAKAPWAQLFALPLQKRVPRSWQSSEDSTGFVGTMSKKLIEKCIAEKAKHLPDYRTRCNRVALLLHVERSRVQGFMEPAFDAADAATMGFDFVYIYMPMRFSGPEVFRVGR